MTAATSEWTRLVLDLGLGVLLLACAVGAVLVAISWAENVRDKRDGTYVPPSERRWHPGGYR